MLFYIPTTNTVQKLHWQYNNYNMQSSQLINKFHFYDIHRGMNAMGRVQSKGRHVNFARDPLRSYFDECQNLKFISYIYIILGIFSINYN